MFEYEYYFGEKLRLGLYWGHPNIAGVFLISLLPITWLCIEGTKKQLPVTILLFLSSLTIWQLTLETYSRGALTAFTVTASIFLFRTIGVHRLCKIKILILFMGTLGYSIIAIESEAFERVVDPGETASVSHRIEIWKGALQLFYIKPFTGWGHQQSGFFYTHLIQDPNQKYESLSMVNSFLTLLTESGVLFFTFTIFVILFTIFAGSYSIITNRNIGKKSWIGRISPYLILSLIAFSISSIFTTINSEWTLLITPAISIVFVLSNSMRNQFINFKKIRYLLTISLIVSASLACALFSIGETLLKESGLTFHIGENRTIITSKKEGLTKTKTLIIPDPKVLGPEYGRFCRKLLNTTSVIGIENIEHTLSKPPKCKQIFDIVLVLGKHHENALRYLEVSKNIYLIHPTGLPSNSTTTKVDTLVLPEIDNTGGQIKKWKNWAEKNCIPVIISRDVSYDLRWRWEETLDRLLKRRGQTKCGIST